MAARSGPRARAFPSTAPPRGETAPADAHSDGNCGDAVSLFTRGNSAAALDMVNASLTSPQARAERSAKLPASLAEAATGEKIAIARCAPLKQNQKESFSLILVEEARLRHRVAVKAPPGFDLPARAWQADSLARALSPRDRTDPAGHAVARPLDQDPAHSRDHRLDGRHALSAQAVRLPRRRAGRLRAFRDLQGDGAKAAQGNRQSGDDRGVARPGRCWRSGSEFSCRRGCTPSWRW